MVKKLKITVPIVIHGFSKKQAVANELLASGCYISFGKYLLQNPELESVFKSMPMDRFFLETDTAQQGIEVVYALAARYKGIPMAALQKQINTNFEAVFKTNK
jgi:TatD DNase family protein